MHAESYEAMKTFEREYASKLDGRDVLDVGSLNVNGSYKPIFKKYNYTGLDIVEGSNVDILVKNPYKYPIQDKSYDIVISGNTAEHVKAIWRWFVELARILKKGGLLCVITPHSLPEHRFPVDCWRVLSDGMEVLIKHAGLEKLEVRRTTMDTVGIAKR